MFRGNYVSAHGGDPSGSFEDIEGGIVNRQVGEALPIERETTNALYPAGREGEIWKVAFASGACTGRVGRVDKDDCAASVYSFAREFFFEVAPTAIQNTFGKVRVAHHIGDTQVFDSNPVVADDERVHLLVEEVMTGVGDVFMQALHATKSALRLFLPPLTLRARERCATRSTFCEVRYHCGLSTFAPSLVVSSAEITYVDADTCTCCWQRQGVGLFHREAGVPFTCALDDAYLLHFAH